MKQYHALIVLFLLLTPSFCVGWSNYESTKRALMEDMDQALQKTLAQQTSIEISPDTIQMYLAHLQVPVLREQSYIYYAMDERRDSLCSTSVRWSNGTEECEFRSYATCSFATILSLSDQRWSLMGLLLSVLWGVGCIVYFRRQPSLAVVRVGGISMVGDRFYGHDRQPIHFTAMQEQLMKMFFADAEHRLTKQAICDALWPKKPDASDTLYTLIKRLKPVIEEQGGLQISNERGKEYSLEVKK